MPRDLTFKSILVVSMLTSCSDHTVEKAMEEVPVLKGAYLGQTPPGSTPKVFAPGIVSTEEWGDAGIFSADMQKFHVSRWRHDGSEERRSVTFERVGDSWQEVADPAGTHHPFYAPDGKTLHYGAKYKEPMADGWSEMKSLGSAFEGIAIMALSASGSGTLVFDEQTKDGDGVLRYSRLVDGKREDPKPLPEEINLGKWNAHPFIAPDESYIMWDGERRSGHGSSDIYISFRQADGSWGEAFNLGDKINTEAGEVGPGVSPDGKYLFFNRMVKSGAEDGGLQSDLYWVDAKIIDELRPRLAENVSPEATAREAAIKHWSMPDLKRNFWHLPLLGEAWIDTTPTDLNDGISVGELGVDGGNRELILALAQEIADKKHQEVDGLLIAHKGKLLFESYYARGRIDLPHPQSSTTKGYTALALGRAIQLGYLTMADLDKPVASFLEGLDPSKFVDGADKITLHHALNMSSGLLISEENMDKYRKNADQYNGLQQVQAFFEDSAPVTDAARQFDYESPNPIMVMQVVEAVVPGSAEEFIREEVFGKMGITNYSWRTDQSGLPRAEFDSSLTARDMVRIGTMVMNGGKWNDVQLLPEAYAKRLVQKNVQISEEQAQAFYSGDRISNFGYGYFWWPMDLKAGNRRYVVTSAQGGGGLTILAIEELDLVVVITAHARQAYIQMIAEKILPAFTQ